MTAFDELGRAIAAWLEDAAAAPDPNYLQDALGRVERMRQRRREGWAALMPAPLGRRAAIFVALAALLVAVVGLSLLSAAIRPPAPIRLPMLGHLVYSRDGTLFVAEPDGSDPRPISATDMQLRLPRWSSDGTRILAWGARVPSNGSIHPGEVWVMDADGRGVRSITASLAPMFVDAVAWSPDNRRIAITAEGRLFVADADGSRAIPIHASLTRAPMLPTAGVSWSPDGTELAVVLSSGSGTDGVLAVVDVRTGDVTVIPTAGPLGYASIDLASWSPSGDAIAYVATEALPGDWWTGEHVMVATRQDGSWTESVLVRGPVPARFEVTRKPIPQHFARPAWSNDAARIAWIQGAFGERSVLWAGAADGSAARRLADLPVSDLGDMGAPAWLPDDSRIAVPTVPESTVSFLLVDPDGIEPSTTLDGVGGTLDWQGVNP